MAWLETRLNGRPIFKVGARVRHKTALAPSGDPLIGKIVGEGPAYVQAAAGKTHWETLWDNADWVGTNIDPEYKLELVDSRGRLVLG